MVLDKEFSCLFCNHEKTVTAKIDMENKIGQLTCSACGVSFQTMVTSLSEPVDVYSDWIDACELANEGQKTTMPSAPTYSSKKRYTNEVDDDDDDEDDDADLL
ncbi:hypothetical protein BASA81_002873 [Batrachochytrium salamandrivorans]|nr:hypothetical protein BASA81_002873 [Batrachochytrium salamandrivorans]